MYNIYIYIYIAYSIYICSFHSYSSIGKLPDDSITLFMLCLCVILFPDHESS